LVLATDITSHQREVEQALEAQRVELIGRIAGGVAHHFNNILTVISGHTEVLMGRASTDELTSHLKKMSVATHRGVCLTRQLLAAGGQQTLDLAPVDLHGCLRRMEPTLQRVLEGVSLRTHFSNTLAPAQADARAVENIVIALVLNGRDAMGGKGELTLSTRAVRINQSDARCLSGLKPGEYICLKVSDTGCGMTPEVQARIYEPFFTTKDVGQARGLGLASAYGLIRQQSGWIEWRSEVKKGTDVEVLLPRALKTAGASAGLVTALKSRTVLLVEPDERARALARYVLNRIGHTVIECDSAALAWSFWESQHSRIELLLTAIALPGEVPGQKLAKRLQLAKPSLKVLYTCGDSDQDKELSTGLESDSIVAKPYTAEKMLKSIEKILADS
jgi:nitrogen-specific signal transduction histidine kinase